jgi:hypothetical protein
MLSNGEVVILHVDFEYFYFFVRRTSSQIFVVGRDLHFENVVIVDLYGLGVLLGHVLAEKINVTFVVTISHSLKGIAHGDGPYAVLGLKSRLVLVVFV